LTTGQLWQHSNSAQDVHTIVPLSSSTILWYWSVGYQEGHPTCEVLVWLSVCS